MASCQNCCGPILDPHRQTLAHWFLSPSQSQLWSGWAPEFRTGRGDKVRHLGPVHQRRRLIGRGLKPGLMQLGFDDHGRALFIRRLMKAFHQRMPVGIDGQHGEADDGLACGGRGPALPQAGYSERALAGQADLPADRAARFVIWLIKMVLRPGFSSFAQAGMRPKRADPQAIRPDRRLLTTSGPSKPG